MREVAGRFDHVEVHADTWERDVPASSLGCHEFLRAVDLVAGVDTNAIAAVLDDGRAHAALSLDQRLARDLQVQVSPSFVFNEGRQRLYGNVGYRVIEANVRELLHRPTAEASWC